MSQAPLPNRREFFRLQFPRRERALVRTASGRFPVRNISAGGALFDEVDLAPEPGPLSGTLRLPSGAVVRFEGHARPRGPGQWVLEFFRGPTVEQMLDEQRRLIRCYPLSD